MSRVLKFVNFVWLYPEFNEDHCTTFAHNGTVEMEFMMYELGFKLNSQWFAFVFSQHSPANINSCLLWVTTFKIQNMNEDKTHVGANKWALCLRKGMKRRMKTTLCSVNAKSSESFPYEGAHTSSIFVLKKCFISVILMTIPFITSIYHGWKRQQAWSARESINKRSEPLLKGLHLVFRLHTYFVLVWNL